MATAPPNDSLPFVLHDDTTLLLWTSDEGKKVVCMSDLLCSLASQRGMMQVTLIDHDMVQRTQDPGSCSFTVCSCEQVFVIVRHSVCVFCQDNNEPMNFRYTLTPKPRVHTFEPKRLPPETDLKDLRFAQLGAVLANQKRLATLPSSKHFGLAWEVLVLAFISLS